MSTVRSVFVPLFLFFYSMIALLFRPVTAYIRQTVPDPIAAINNKKQDHSGDTPDTHHAKFHLGSFSSDGMAENLATL